MLDLNIFILLLCATLTSRSTSHTSLFERNSPTPVRRRLSLTNPGVEKTLFGKQRFVLSFSRMSYQQSSCPCDVRMLNLSKNLLESICKKNAICYLKTLIKLSIALNVLAKSAAGPHLL